VTLAAFTPAQGIGDSDAARDLAIRAAATAGIRVVEAHDSAGCARVAAVLDAIWGRETPMLDTGLLVALAHSGNYVAIVEDLLGSPIGAAVGFCGPMGEPFHSHVVGLLPDHVGHGVGRAVKLDQRAWCLKHGTGVMTWTYDPLVARNAYFNLRRLGATAVEHLPDFYGTMTDAINAGQHSDRILIAWDLSTVPPPARLPEPPTGDATPVVAEVAGRPTAYTPPPDAATRVTVAVPVDVESLRRTDPALAARWRAETRAALTDLLNSGWRITGFARPGDASRAYVIEREGTA
jgi:predicted GNAT superfamily acetyltransferase